MIRIANANTKKEENIVIEIKKAKIEDINIIKEKKNEIEKNKKYELITKLLSTIIETYEKHPSNYFTTLNIKNVASIIKDINNNNKRNKDEIFEIFQIQKEKQDILLKEGLKKLEVLENRLKEIVNVRLGISLDRDKIKIDLNDKNVLNLELNNLNLDLDVVEFEEINLSRNNISDIKPFKNLNSPKLKKIDLSYNKMSGINQLKEAIDERKKYRLKRVIIYYQLI